MKFQVVIAVVFLTAFSASTVRANKCHIKEDKVVDSVNGAKFVAPQPVVGCESTVHTYDLSTPKNDGSTIEMTIKSFYVPAGVTAKMTVFDPSTGASKIFTKSVNNAVPIKSAGQTLNVIFELGAALIHEATLDAQLSLVPYVATTTSPTTTTPEIITTTPEMRTTTPEMSTTTPEMSTKTPEMSTTTPEMSTKTPEMSTTTPKMSTTTPEMSTTTPEMSTTTPEMSTTTPEMSTTTPEMSTTTPEMSTTTPEMSTTTPKMSTTTPEMSTTTDGMSTTTSEGMTTTSGKMTTTTTNKCDVTEDKTVEATNGARFSAPKPVMGCTKTKYTFLLRTPKNDGSRIRLAINRFEIPPTTTASMTVYDPKTKKTESFTKDFDKPTAISSAGQYLDVIFEMDPSWVDAAYLDAELILVAPSIETTTGANTGTTTTGANTGTTTPTSGTTGRTVKTTTGRNVESTTTKGSGSLRQGLTALATVLLAMALLV